MKIDDGIDKEELKEITTPAKSYARYGALAFQMAAVIALAVWGGRWLDGLVGWKFPLFTIVLLLAALTGVIWSVYRSLSKGG
jgi:hypothetical protein